MPVCIRLLQLNSPYSWTLHNEERFSLASRRTLSPVQPLSMGAATVS
jgi:hypothetical protein